MKQMLVTQAVGAAKIREQESVKRGKYKRTPLSVSQKERKNWQKREISNSLSLRMGAIMVVLTMLGGVGMGEMIGDIGLIDTENQPTEEDIEESRVTKGLSTERLGVGQVSHMEGEISNSRGRVLCLTQPDGGNLGGNSLQGGMVIFR